MAILEEEIWVNVTGNPKHYEDLGYEIPKRIDSKGNLSIKRGTKILVKVKDLPKGSTVKVTKVCDICGTQIPNQSYGVIIKYRERGDGKDRCFSCGRFKAAKTIVNNVPKERSLEYFAMISGKEYLILEYSDKNKKKPRELYKNSEDICVWNCPKCKSEYTMSVSARTSGNNCPFCRGLRVNETNCLNTVLPDIAKLLTNKEDGYKVTRNSEKKLNFTCPDCGHIQEKPVVRVVTQGFSCQKCSDGISYPEKFMINLLDQLNVRYEFQKIFNWSKNVKVDNKNIDGDKVYDFYIKTLNCIIEVNGEQHYNEKTTYGKNNKGLTFRDIQENDKLKYELAIKNNINKYIVIDCSLSDKNYIKNNILNSELTELFNLSDVDWDKCEKWALNSLVKKTCNLWEQGYSVSEICKELNISRSTVNRYLKRGRKIGWTTYTPVAGGWNKLEVFQFNLKGEFVGNWESAKQAAQKLNISHQGIVDSCNGKLVSSGGFMWRYKKDYEKNRQVIKPAKWKNNKEVVQLSLDLEYVNEYISLSEASRITGVHREGIRRTCLGKYKQSGGYKWMYKEDYEKEILNAK